MFVKLPGSLVQGVDEQCPNPGTLRNESSPFDSILQQGGAKLGALGALIDRQPRKYHHRHRVGHVAPYAACCGAVRDRAGSQGVISKNAPLFVCDNKGSAGAALVVDECPAPEPIVEAGFPTCKSSS